MEKKTAQKTSEKTMEELFEELDGVMENLENPDTPLEEAFSWYEKGVRLVRACSERIDRVEKQIMVLQGGEAEDGNS